MRCPDVFSQRGRGYGHALSPLLLLHLTFTIVQLNEEVIKDLVRGSVEEALNELLEPRLRN